MSALGRGAAVLHVVAATLLLAGCGQEQASAPAGRPPPAKDTRLAWLLEPFPRDEHYDVDTSDTTGILVETLRHGQRDPLRAARVQLAQQGPAGVEAARRMIEAAWNDPSRFADIRNALDVLAYSDDPSAHAAIRRVLEHEHPTPRRAAWRALREHPRPEDYDLIHRLYEGENQEFRAELALLLHRLDPGRAEDEYTAWIAEGLNVELWPEIASTLAQSTRERTGRRCCSLYDPDEPVPVQLLLAAACARTGEAAALDLLRGLQRDERPLVRQNAVDALVEAQILPELVWTLERDPSPELRRKAAHAIGIADPADELDAALQRGMNDSSDLVAATCTALLVGRGHEGAIERALQDLGSQRPGALVDALTALAPALERDPDVARRAFERLAALDQRQLGLPLSRRKGLLRAIGLIPLGSSARYLLELSEDVQGELDGLPAARWVCLQVGNAGEPGQRLLQEALGTETDPLRRIDLIESLAASPTELARAWLLERAEAPDIAPYELLYIADRLVRLGPIERVAPVLKRATLRVEQADVRRSLQGLLWTWYPAPQRP